MDEGLENEKWTEDRSMREDRRPPRREEDPDDDDDEAPETPLDEPTPPPVQDPPNEPDKRPYTVQHPNDVTATPFQSPEAVGRSPTR
jgi:hypothetical protein